MGHVTTLQARRSSRFQWYSTVQLVDLRGLDMVTDVLTVPAQRVLDAGHECPVGPLGGKGQRWDITAGLVQLARWVIADAQKCHGRVAACTLKVVTFSINLGK